MKMQKLARLMSIIAGATATLLITSKSASSQLALVERFDLGINFCGVAFDDVADTIFTFTCFSNGIDERTKNGSLIDTISSPGAISNNFDLDFLTEPTNIDGTLVPANTLLAINGDNTPDIVYALDKNNGSILSSIPSGSQISVGGAYSPERDSFFLVEPVPREIIGERNLTDGTTIESFSYEPVGSPSFTVSFGDLDVLEASGNLFVISGRFIRELTPTGDFVRDYSISEFGILNASGIAFDDASGEAYIVEVTGQLTIISGFEATTPESIPESSNVLGLFLVGGVSIVTGIKFKKKEDFDTEEDT
ncbi:MAG: hypothetical protein AB4041_12725 [Microcystaceae cyanobacterium]